jgi:hypothetical protein
MSRQQSDHVSLDTESLANAVGLLSLNASSDPKYLGSSSGIPLAHLMWKLPFLRGSPASFPVPDPSSAEDTKANSIRPQALPPFNEAMILVQTYFDIVHCQYPFLHKPSFLKVLDEIYKIDTEDHGRMTTRLRIYYFQVFMILAVGSSALFDNRDAALAVIGFFASATQYIDEAFSTVCLEAAQAQLLLAMYALFNPDSELNVWFLNARIMASCVDLGFHRSIGTRSWQGNGRGLSPLEIEMRKRIFWCAYALDRNVSTSMGRPLGLRDEACDVEVSISSLLLRPFEG